MTENANSNLGNWEEGYEALMKGEFPVWKAAEGLEAAKTAKDAKADRLKAISKMDMDEFKREFKDENLFKEFLSLSNLAGTPAVAVEFALLPEFKLTGVEKIADHIFMRLDKDKLKGAVASFGAQEEDLSAVKATVARVYANQADKIVRGEFLKKYPRYVEFLSANKDKKLNINVEFPGGADLKAVFDDQDFKDGYDGFVSANPKAKTAEEVAAEKKAAEESAAKEASDNEKAKELAKTPVGKILSALGYGTVPEPPETQNGFQKIIAGRDPFILFLLSLIPGYTKFVGADMGGLTDLLPEKAKARLENIKNRFKDSKLKYEDPSVGEKPAEGISYESFDLDKFGKLERGEIKMPEKGVVLSDPIDLDRSGIGKVTVDLKNGGEVTIPKGVEVRVDGKAFLDKNADHKLDPVQHTIEGTIPAGVIFKGPVAFVHPEATDQAKV